ncbi:lysine N(6)-hydroxylase/L-ornithine N(5)-oxygenase family protein [Streptomyces sp. AK02-04a]|uniref:lysine N(6)-hydroxylase/L-ornithine N(5)-oxygenase family protein n=1 Tax=Streptomyces sp. AK02-04a TaxID=3028649 RepID=UPI0029B01022|nr:SidA/IucD/PvdA family monooxygenase [Streptomyces sp. AK02-04a]MDX3763963.1 SidA/IucD/PvdA family monooxygenase [Streptomyces sp. AK02-04a]
MSEETEPYDLIGVGIDPFNASLAALAEPLSDLSVLFLEAQPRFTWRPGLRIEESQACISLLADLVTLVDPTSRWSFLSYLRAHSLAFPFLSLKRFHISRLEYDHYCRWVVTSLPACVFDRSVGSVRWDAEDRLFHVEHTDSCGRSTVDRAVNVVLGTGAEPVVPPQFSGLVGKHVLHVADYQHHARALREAEDVTVVGSTQAAAEVFLDLLRSRNGPDNGLRWLSPSSASPLAEYSRGGPERVASHYAKARHAQPQRAGNIPVPAQWQPGMVGVEGETITDLCSLFHERSVVTGNGHADLMPGATVISARRSGERYELHCRYDQSGQEFRCTTDRIVLATGDAPISPVFLDPMVAFIEWEGLGRYRIDSHFRVALAPQISGSMFAYNSGIRTHGNDSADLGLGAWRGATIINALLGRDQYHLSDRTVLTKHDLWSERTYV